MRIVSTHHTAKIAVPGNIEWIEEESLPACKTEELAMRLNEIGGNVVVSRQSDFLRRVFDLAHSGRLPDTILLYLTDSESNSPSSLIFQDFCHTVTCAEKDYESVRVLQYVEALLASRIELPKPDMKMNFQAKVISVGSGIVNLISTLNLVRQGYKVQIYSADQMPYQESQWKQYGCTLAGNDARIFSFNESRNHHFTGDALLESANKPYRNLVKDNGWLIRSPHRLSDRDLQWIETFESYPQWLKETIHKDIIAFNIESYEYWRKLEHEVPELFEETGYVNSLYRVYSTEAQLEKGVKSETEIGAFIRQLQKDEIQKLFPGMGGEQQDAFTGVIEVEGFGINVHKFTMRLIAYLESLGVTFHWNRQINEIIFDSNGWVKWLQTDDEIAIADFYLLSPGVPRRQLLKGTASNDQIASMLGCWMTLPDFEQRINYPLKVARSGYAADEAAAGANIIPGTDALGNPIIHISSGHGFLGLEDGILEDELINDLTRCVHETAQSLFPEQYEAAWQLGWLNQPPRYCIRPWTPSCLGLFEMIPAVGGGLLVITGGHNTGGFAQSPAVAAAVSSAFAGASHPMHHLYHPERLKRFFEVETDQQQVVFVKS